MSIKEKIETAKEKAKRRVRKAAVGAALVGTLGAGAVSCGENYTQDKKYKNLTKNVYFSDYDMEGNEIEDTKRGFYISEDGDLKKSTFDGHQLQKSAVNKGDPDSLLVEVLDGSRSTIDGNDVIHKDHMQKVTYTPIDPNDKGEFEIDDASKIPYWERHKLHTDHFEYEEVTEPVTYDAAGRRGGKVKKAKEIMAQVDEQGVKICYKLKNKDEGR